MAGPEMLWNGLGGGEVILRAHGATLRDVTCHVTFVTIGKPLHPPPPYQLPTSAGAITLRMRGQPYFRSLSVARRLPDKRVWLNSGSRRVG